MSETARHGRTLAAELLPCRRTGGASIGPTEAMNLLSEEMHRVGHGYRTCKNYRLQPLLHCGTD